MAVCTVTAIPSLSARQWTTTVYLMTEHQAGEEPIANSIQTALPAAFRDLVRSRCPDVRAEERHQRRHRCRLIRSGELVVACPETAVGPGN